MEKKSTLKNKIYGSLLIFLGFLTIFIDYTATAFVLLLVFGIPLFFAKENWID